MASEIMNRIDETERLCDERVAQAQAGAAQAIGRAKEQAVQMKAEAVAKARAQAEEIIARADKAAAQTMAEAEAKAQSDISAMRDAARGNTARAVNAVAKRIVEWNGREV